VVRIFSFTKDEEAKKSTKVKKVENEIETNFRDDIRTYFKKKKNWKKLRRRIAIFLEKSVNFFDANRIFSFFSPTPTHPFS
jgi:hypothetical protein